VCECRVKAILQVVDAAAGPATKREYGVVTVPVGDGALGKVVDFLGREVDLSGAGAEAGGAQTTTSATPPPPLVPGSAAFAPLFALPPTMDAREPISEPLHTGVKGIDALTPVGRGQCLLVLGGRGSGKSTACRDAAIAAARAGVRVSWAAVGEGGGAAELRELVEAFERADVLGSVTVVCAAGGAAGGAGLGAPLAQRYAAVCAAAALGERTRDAGGHALLVVDDAACVPATWDSVAEELAALGRDAADGDGDARKSPRGLLEAAAGGESPRGAPDDGGGAAGAPAGAGAAAPSSPSSAPSAEDGAAGEALVEYEGMLVSAAAAARRRFLGSLLQRPAKMSRARGGGSLTALVVLPGAPARGIRGAAGAAAASALSSPPLPPSSPSSSSPTAPAAPSSATAEAVRRRIASGAYSTLSEEQKRKLEAALSSGSSGSSSGTESGGERSDRGGQGGLPSPSPPLSRSDDGEDTDLTGCVRTEVIEEFMSIADGQAVFVRPLLSASAAAAAAKGGGDPPQRGPPSVEPASSISRIGGRALPVALRPLAASLRLDLSQAADAERFGGGGGGDGDGSAGASGTATASATATAATATAAAAPPSKRSATVARAARTRAALLQPAGHPTSVSDLFVTLSALERGLLDNAPQSAVPRRLALLLTSLRRRSASCAALLRRMDESGGDEAVSELEAEELVEAMREAARELEGVPPE